MAINYYEYIGLTQQTTNNEIKARCNTLLLDYHTDRCKDICFEEATETVRLIIEIRQTLLDPEKRRAYDLTLSGISHERVYEPTFRQICYCKEKEGERCYEEEGIALPECSGCLNCTDPKVLKRRKERAIQKEREEYEKRRKQRMTVQSDYQQSSGYSDYKENIYSSSKNYSGEKKESIFKRMFNWIFG